jgi:hypothetical protein
LRFRLLGMAVCLLTTGAGVCQEPTRDGAPPQQGASLEQPQAADARNAEINELRASLLQIQTRLDQIAPPTAKNQRATSWPAPISAITPYVFASKLSASAFCLVSIALSTGHLLPSAV